MAMTGTNVVTAEDVGAALHACGIAAGDTIMLHSDAIVTAQFRETPPERRIDLLIDAILAVLGSAGTLTMPTFTYSFARGEPFDLAQSASTVGIVTEHFRRRSGVRRSADPLFSVAAWGHHAELFANAAADDCFGDGSAFALLRRVDATIACLGCAFDRVTFVHHVEQAVGVDYRYRKRFAGTLIRDGVSRPAHVDYLVRDLDRDTQTDLRRLEHRLRERGKLGAGVIGRIGVTAVKARDFFDVAAELLAEDPAALIREGGRTA
jgi:aminoglycoside 3-N-acetyltransferase